MPADEPIAIDAAPVLPDHNYDEKRGWTYYYVAAISEEDRKKGRAAGAVVAYEYLGLNEDGRHVLANMNPNGKDNHVANQKRTSLKSSHTCDPSMPLSDYKQNI